jgi:hypothetical protein
MVTNDGFNRWSQVVRTPGAAILHGSHAVEVPPIAGLGIGEVARPGVRLLTMPLTQSPPFYTIDITSTQVQAMLEGFLGTGAGIGKILSWRARGFGSLRKDTIRIRPMP